MKKLILLISIFIISITSVFAMPGFTPYFQDRSGDFVYYRDYTFARESYIGILEYDSSKYQIRYYAPAVPAKNLPEKEVALLISINPNANHMEFTGETTISKISNDAETIEIMNYLHDVLYEFSSRRIKVSDVSPDNSRYTFNSDYKKTGLSVSQDYEQFGGKVNIVFDCVIPFFNIKSITNPAGTVLLECITFGSLQDNQDKSFSNFKPMNFDNIPSKLEKMNKKAKTKSIKYGSSSVAVDNSWEQNSNNLYIFGDEAMLLLSEFTIQNSDFIKNSLFIFKNAICNGQGTYIYLPDLSLNYDKRKKELTFISTIYLSDDNFPTKHTLILTQNKKEKEKIHYFELTTTYYAYSAHKKYYENIIKSYTIN